MSVDLKKVFARNLQYYMDRDARNQKEVADAIAVPYPTMNSWIKGNKYPRMDKVEKLANYFGIEKSDLIEERNDEKLTENEISKVLSQLSLDAKRQILDYALFVQSRESNK